MGQGGYIFCEWDSITKEDIKFKTAFKNLEDSMKAKCDAEWAPRAMGYLVPHENEYGRTSILPRLFLGYGGAVLPHWRQNILVAGNQVLLTGVGAGNTIPEDFKVAWIGLAFPNKQMQISEIKWQIGDRKYGRINIEELKSYNKPAIIFEEGLIIDGEQSFDLHGYVETPDYQRIVMLGAAYYKYIDKVLGQCGAAVPVT